MLRWYDYVLAVIAADIITTFTLASLTADNFWMNLLYGLLAGMAYSAWKVDYCAFRWRQEHGK